jgi:hypothetical protein
VGPVSISRYLVKHVPGVVPEYHLKAEQIVGFALRLLANSADEEMWTALEKTLQNSSTKFLFSASSPCFADLILWESFQMKQHISNLNHIRNWVDNLSELPPFQQTLRVFLPNSVYCAYDPFVVVFDNASNSIKLVTEKQGHETPATDTIQKGAADQGQQQSNTEIPEMQKLKRLDSKQKLLQEYALLDSKLASLEKRTQERAKRQSMGAVPLKIEKLNVRQEDLDRNLKNVELRIEKLEQFVDSEKFQNTS